MTRKDYLAQQISKAVNVEVNVDFTIAGEILIDHEGNINQAVLNYFKKLNVVEIEYDEICNTTFYTFAA